MNLHRKMQSKMKKILIVVFSILFLFSIFFLMKTILIKPVKEESVTRYDYKLNKNISFQVHMKDNEIYDKEIKDEDIYYIKKFVDYIDIIYTVNFIGSSQAPIDIEYQALADLVGFSYVDDVKNVFWSKKFLLKEVKQQNINQNSYDISETVRVSVDEYEGFIERLKETAEFSSSNEITFFLKGAFLVDTPYGEVNKPFELTLSTPLGGGTIKLSKGDLTEEKDSITETVKVTKPMSVILLVVYSATTLLCLLCILYLCIFTHRYEFKDTLLCNVKKIKKEFGSRMVELQNDIMKSYQYQFDVHSIKDLIKVSDELQKPIFYMIDDNDIVKDYKFCVQNGDDIYVYNVLTTLMECKNKYIA